MKWIIGCDPSSSKNKNGDFANLIGFAVFCDEKLMEIGEIIPDPLTGFTRVRRWIRDKIRMIHVRDESPQIIVACESAYYGKNVAVFAGLIRMKAHVESAVLDLGHSYREISPLRSFQASTGLSQYPLKNPKDPKSGRSNTRKPAIQNAVKARYNLPDDTSEHCCDSIAICEAILKYG